MSYVSTGANDRAHLKSQALALEGKTTIARLIPPPTESIIAAPARFADYFRVRIDPVKSDTANKLVLLEFADGSKAGLHIRRAVAEFVADPDRHARKPDITLAMTGQTWAKPYLSQAAPEELTQSGEIVVKADAAEAARLINLFDRYRPGENGDLARSEAVLPSIADRHDGSACGPDSLDNNASNNSRAA